MFKRQLEDKIKKDVKELYGLAVNDVLLSSPRDPRWGDCTTSLPLTLAKALNQSPMAIASRLEKALSKDKSLGVECQAAAPGFLNFTFSPSVLLKELSEIFRERDLFGSSKGRAQEKIMVEFAHPNTHKEFHIGHLRNLCLGESLVRLLESQGARVVRANYQGDVGLHVAKALWGLLKVSSIEYRISKAKERSLPEKVKLLGQAYAEGHKAYEAGGRTQAEVMEINKKVYERDPSLLPLWQETRQWSLDCFETIYRRLRTHFDRYYFESEVFAPGLKIAQAALAGGILKESEGAVVFDGAAYGLDTRVFVTGEGLPTYEAKELGLARLEFSEFGELAKCIHVVAPEQTSFFKVTFKVEELLNPAKFAGRQEHFAYGYVDLKEGKMSSRAGQVVTALAVIEAAKTKARALIKDESLGAREREEVAEKVAVGAVKYSMLRYDARRNITFDLNESVALSGNSGPYLQYTFARTQAVLRKAQGLRLEVGDGKLDDQAPSFQHLAVEEINLLRTLPRFPEVVSGAAEKYAPNLVAEYLYNLAQKFNHFYNNLPILTPSSQLPAPNFRLALTAATAQIIRNGLYLLGIATLERM